MQSVITRRRAHLDGVAIATVVLLCALWGVQSVTVKLAVADGLPPVLQGAVRSAGASLLCVAWIGLRQGRGGLRALVRRDGFLRPGVLLGAIFGIEFALMYCGLRLTTASRAVLLLYAAPLFTALALHWLMPGERLRRWQAAGLVFAFAGVAAALSDGLLHGQGRLAGDACCFAAAALWGWATVIIRTDPGVRGVAPGRLLLAQLGGSVPVMLAVSAAMGELHAWPQASAAGWVLLLGYQTVVVAFASYLLWMWLLLIYPVNLLSGFTFLAPVFGVLAAGLLLDERLTPTLLLGLGGVAIGLLLLNRRPRSA